MCRGSVGILTATDNVLPEILIKNFLGRLRVLVNLRRNKRTVGIAQKFMVFQEEI